MNTKNTNANGNVNAPARRSHIRWSYPTILSLILALSAVELGLSAFLTSRFNSHHNAFSHSEVSRVRYLIFSSIWTIVVGLVYFLMFLLAVSGIITSIASHSLFLFITWVIWVIAASLITSTLKGNINCSNDIIFAYCNRVRTSMGIAWAIFGLLTILLLLVCTRGRHRSRGDGYGYRSPLHENHTV